MTKNFMTWLGLFLKKGVAVFVCTALLITSVSLPQVNAEISSVPTTGYRSLTDDLTAIALPKEIGKIQEIYRGTSDKTVVLIQDAHSIPDAQSSIQSAINHFQSQYGISLVGLEGASEKLNPQIFRSFPDKKLFRKTFDTYAQRGELTGGTAAALFNASNSTYQGIEDWPLYEEGVSHFLKAMEMEPEIMVLLHPMVGKLNKEKETVYPKDLLEIDRLLTSFGENKTDLMQVLNRLSQYRLPSTGSELALLVEEIKTNQQPETGDNDLQIEVKKIAGQVVSVLKRQSLSPEARQQLHEFNGKFQEFQTSEITPQAFALYLKGMVKKLKIRVKVSHALVHLVENQRRLRDIEGTRLFEEFKIYADSVKESFFQNKQQKILDVQTQGLELIKRLARLELSFEDWGKIQKMILQLDQWTIVQDGVVSRDEVSLLFKKMEPHLDFYRVAEKRDQVFLKNTQAMMEKENKTSSLLVAGGFHTEGLTQTFKAKGISYVLVMPSIGVIPEEPLYREHMQGQVSWSDYFEVKDGKVNLYDAFVRATRDRLLSRATGHEPRATGNKDVERGSSNGERSSEDRHLMKSWRDQIIRDLADQGRLAEAGDYTRFIDEISNPDNQALEARRKKWLANIDRFGEGLKKLQIEGNLSEVSIAQLIKTITTAEPVLAGALTNQSVNVELLSWKRSSANPESEILENNDLGKRSESRADLSESEIKNLLDQLESAADSMLGEKKTSPKQLKFSIGRESLTVDIVLRKRGEAQGAHEMCSISEDGKEIGLNSGFMITAHGYRGYQQYVNDSSFVDYAIALHEIPKAIAKQLKGRVSDRFIDATTLYVEHIVSTRVGVWADADKISLAAAWKTLNVGRLTDAEVQAVSKTWIEKQLIEKLAKAETPEKKEKDVGDIVNFVMKDYHFSANDSFAADAARHLFSDLILFAEYPDEMARARFYSSAIVVLRAILSAKNFEVRARLLRGFTGPQSQNKDAVQKRVAFIRNIGGIDMLDVMMLAGQAIKDGKSGERDVNVNTILEALHQVSDFIETGFRIKREDQPFDSQSVIDSTSGKILQIFREYYEGKLSNARLSANTENAVDAAWEGLLKNIVEDDRPETAVIFSKFSVDARERVINLVRLYYVISGDDKLSSAEVEGLRQKIKTVLRAMIALNGDINALNKWLYTGVALEGGSEAAWNKNVYSSLIAKNPKYEEFYAKGVEAKRTYKLPGVQQASSIRVVIKKDFWEDVSAGFGEFAKCYHSLGGNHRFMPLVHGLEADSMFLRIYDGDKLIGNAVIIIGDNGAFLFPVYTNADARKYELIKLTIMDTLEKFAAYVPSIGTRPNVEGTNNVISLYEDLLPHNILSGALPDNDYVILKGSIINNAYYDGFTPVMDLQYRTKIGTKLRVDGAGFHSAAKEKESKVSELLAATAVASPEKAVPIRQKAADLITEQFGTASFRKGLYAALRLLPDAVTPGADIESKLGQFETEVQRIMVGTGEEHNSSIFIQNVRSLFSNISRAEARILERAPDLNEKERLLVEILGDSILPIVDDVSFPGSDQRKSGQGRREIRARSEQRPETRNTSIRVVSENGELWFDQGWLAGYMNFVTTSKSRPDYQSWIENPTSLQGAMTDPREEYEEENIAHYLKNQAEHSEQSLVELTSNGLDAVSAWISRFGLGFYQALGELNQADDRVFFAGEKKNGQRLGVVFRRSNEGFVQVRPMTSAELAGYLGDNHQTTIVRVQKKLSEEQQKSYRDYLRDRVEGSRRMPLRMDGDEINNLNNFSSVTGKYKGPAFYDSQNQIHIQVDAEGYSVSNPGQISPEIIFERLLPPRQGRPTGSRHAVSEGQLPESDILFKMPQDPSAEGESKLTVQVAEMGVEVIHLKGMNLPARAVIKLPANISLNVERGKAKIDEKYKKAMIALIEKLNDMEDLKEIATIANLLWAYWKEISDEDEFNLQIIASLQEKLNKTITQIIQARRQKEVFSAVPALGFFLQMKLEDASNKIYFYPELFQASLTPIPGLERVENEFTSETNMSLYHVAYKENADYPAIMRVGNMIILSRKHYEEMKNDPLKWMQINWPLTFQPGYGAPIDELGWWDPQAQEKAQAPRQEIEGEQARPDFENAMKELADVRPKAFSDEQAWSLWVQEQLFPSQKGKEPLTIFQIRERLKAWNEWAELTLPEMNHPFGSALWSLSLPTDSFHAWDNQKIHGALYNQFYILPDGRKIFLKANENEPPYLFVETEKGSNQWSRKKVNGIHLKEIEKYINPFNKNKPLYINFTKDGRLLLSYGGGEIGDFPTGQKKYKNIYFLEKTPGSGDFQMITFPDGVGLDQHCLAHRDSLSSMLNPDGRLFLNITHDNDARLGVFLSETSPGSGQFVRVPINGLPTDDRLNLLFLPDGRMYFKDFRDQKRYRQVSAQGSSFQRVEDLLPPGYSTFIELNDGRLLISDEEDLSRKASFPNLQIETAPGSGVFMPITVRGKPFHLKKDRNISIKIIDRRIVIESSSREGNGKTYFYIYEQGSNEIKPVYLGERRMSLLEVDKNRAGVRHGPDGRLVVVIIGGSEGFKKLYRETSLGSGALQEIMIPAKDPNFEGEERIQRIEYMPDGRMVLISEKRIYKHETHEIVDLPEDWLVETSYGSGQFARVPDRRKYNGEYITLTNGVLQLLTVDPELTPPHLSDPEQQRIQVYVEQNREGMAQGQRFKDRFFRNLTLLGSLAVKRISLACFLETTAMKALGDDSADKLAALMKNKSFTHQEKLLSFANLLVPTALSSPELFNRHIQRWIELVLMNEKLAGEFLDLIKDNPDYLTDEELDIAKTPKSWQGVILFFRDAEGKILPTQRPSTVEDVFNKDQPVASLSTGPISLAALLTLQARRQADLRLTDPRALTLEKVRDLLSEELENPDFDTRAQEDKIPRVVQGQEDGNAVFVRELVMNGRDAMRSNGIRGEKIRISVWLENDKLVVRVEDVVGMNLHKIINAFEPINRHEGAEGTLGQFGQGSKSVWLDGDELRIWTGDGTGRSYITVREARRDANSNLLGIDIVRFDEYDDSLKGTPIKKGTAIEYVKSFAGKTREVQNLAAGLLLKAIYDQLGDVRDVPVTLTTFNEESVQEEVVDLIQVEEPDLGGHFFVGHTLDGKSRVTKDGAVVRLLTEADWEGTPIVVRKQLEDMDNVLMRWPERTPLTMTRDKIAARELDIKRWNQLRLFSIMSASREAFFGQGHWLPDLPQDVLARNYATSDPQTVRDASYFNDQKWWEIDFSRYQDDEKFIGLFILLKPVRQSEDPNEEMLSLAQLESKLQILAEQQIEGSGSQGEDLEKIRKSYPQLESNIDAAFSRKVQVLAEQRRMSALNAEQKSKEGKPLREAGFPLTHGLVESFLQAVREGNTPLREARFSSRKDAQGFVASFVPTAIYFTETWLEKMELALNKIKEQKNNTVMKRHAMWAFLRLLDVMPHEYRHTEEFLDAGRSSHLTHQREGVLENSFPKGMQRVIERAIRNGWDIRKAITGDQSQVTTAAVPEQGDGQPVAEPKLPNRAETRTRSEHRMISPATAGVIANALRPRENGSWPSLGTAEVREVYKITVRGDRDALIAALKNTVEERIAQALIENSQEIPGDISDAMVGKTADYQKQLVSTLKNLPKGTISVGLMLDPENNQSFLAQFVRALGQVSGITVEVIASAEILNASALRGVEIKKRNVREFKEMITSGENSEVPVAVDSSLQSQTNVLAEMFRSFRVDFGAVSNNPLMRDAIEATLASVLLASPQIMEEDGYKNKKTLEEKAAFLKGRLEATFGITAMFGKPGTDGSLTLIGSAIQDYIARRKIQESA